MRRACLAVVGLLILVGVAGCRGSQTGSAPTPSSPPIGSLTPATVNSNPLKLGPNDCTAAPPTSGSPAHSATLGLTVTLPSPWKENPSNEGKQGEEAAFAVQAGDGTKGATISAYAWPATTMSAHEVAIWASTQPGSGNVVATGDCTIAGGQAAFFESTVDLSPFPGIGKKSDGYALWVAHRSKLVYLLINPPTDITSGGVAVETPSPGPPAMPQIKSILGSWHWDQP